MGTASHLSGCSDTAAPYTSHQFIFQEAFSLISVRIPDSRKLLSDLLTKNTFDLFVLGEAQITTFTTFRIDGTWHPEYFESSNQSGAAPARDEEPSWSRIRPIIFEMAKGKHTPLSFRIILKLPKASLQSLLNVSKAAYTADQVDGLFMNISYQGEVVTCTSGTSMKTFTLDKSLDHIWDDMMLRFFAVKGIETEKL